MQSGQDREGGLGHDGGPDRATQRGEEEFMTGGTQGLPVDGQVQEGGGGATHSGDGGELDKSCLQVSAEIKVCSARK